MNPLFFKKQITHSFYPPSISGLVLWLDASNFSSINQSSGLMTSWLDLSSHNYNFTTSQAPNYNITGFNNRPAIMFSGNQNMYNVSAIVNQPDTITIIASFTGNNFSSAPVAIDGYISSSRQVIFANTNEVISYYANNGTQVITGSIPFTGYNCITTIFNGANSSCYVNGILNFTGNPGTNNITNGFMIGESPFNGGGQYWSGPISEVIVYSGVLTTGQIAQIHSYAQKKWGTV